MRPWPPSLYLLCPIVFLIAGLGSSLLPLRVLWLLSGQSSGTSQYLDSNNPVTAGIACTEASSNLPYTSIELPRIAAIPDFSLFSESLRPLLSQTPGSPSCASTLEFARMIVAPGKFRLPVIQQPPGQALYVSSRPDVVTQYQVPASKGITGLLAHNYLAGGSFDELQVGQEIWVTYSGSQVKRYLVTGIFRYQKLVPSSLSSPLVDLETQQELSARQVYFRHYSGISHLTLQTCLEGNGRLDWGLIFIEAEAQ